MSTVSFHIANLLDKVRKMLWVYCVGRPWLDLNCCEYVADDLDGQGLPFHGHERLDVGVAEGLDQVGR